MKTAGIIAEYNPFHNGHQYHIEETKRRTGADYVIVVLSGSFVQRGAPALLNKYDRARMALLSGADLVFELPLSAALSSAEGFATGGIALLGSLGVVDAVSCGCESADEDPALFHLVVALLCDETPAYHAMLTGRLKEGMPYPAARGEAVRECLGADTDSLLSEPNNILAVEYARALKKAGDPMSLTLIPRKESAHNEKELSGEYVSATALRAALLSENCPDLSSMVPREICGMLIEAYERHECLSEDDFSDLLFYALSKNKSRLGEFGPKSFDLAGRTEKLAEQFTTWREFAALLKTKNQTYTAVSRYLAHILLGLTRETLSLAAEYHYAPYARLLGFRQSASPLLKSVRESASIPILSRLAQEYTALSMDQQQLLDLDLEASELYRQVLKSRSGINLRSEFRQPLVTV